MGLVYATSEVTWLTIGMTGRSIDSGVKGSSRPDSVAHDAPIFSRSCYVVAPEIRPSMSAANRIIRRLSSKQNFTGRQLQRYLLPLIGCVLHAFHISQPDVCGEFNTALGAFGDVELDISPLKAKVRISDGRDES